MKGLIKAIALKVSGLALRTRRTREDKTVDAHSRRRHRFVCSHPETQLDGLSVHVRSQIHHRVDVSVRTPTPRLPSRQRVIGRPVDFPGVTTRGYTSPHRW